MTIGCDVTDQAITFTIDMNSDQDSMDIQEFMENGYHGEMDFLSAFREAGDFDIIGEHEYAVLGWLISDPYILTDGIYSSDFDGIKECVEQDLSDDEQAPGQGGDSTCGQLKEYLDDAKFYRDEQHIHRSFLEPLLERGTVSFKRETFGE